MKMDHTTGDQHVEERFAVQSYLDRLSYGIERESARVNFQADRIVDQGRDKKYANRYTIAQLFPDEDPVAVLKRELLKLTVEDYIKTVKDQRFPKRSAMRVFGKEYTGEDVYIKIRVELIDLTNAGGGVIFVMSFHFAEECFDDADFPHRKSR